MKKKIKMCDCFVVAAALLILGLIVYSKAIFGSEMLYYQDTAGAISNSYIDACRTLSQAIRDKSGMGYSFALGLGNDTFALWAKMADPFTLLHILLGVVFGTNAIGAVLPFIQILRSMAAGLACFLFLGKFKFSRGSRIIASALYGFSGFFFTVGQDFSKTILLIYMALLLFIVDKAVEKKKYYLLLALVVGFVCLQGIVAMAVLLPVTVGYLIVQITDKFEGRNMLITQAIYAFLACAGGIFTTAIVWVKLLIHACNTSESFFVQSNLLAELGNSFSVAGLRQLKTALLRLLSNNLQGTAVDYKGYGTYTEAYPLFLSVLLVLCVIQFLYGMFWKKRKETLKVRTVLPLAGLAVYLFMYVAAEATPFFTQLYGQISVIFLPYLVYIIATTLDGIQKEGMYNTVLNVAVTVGGIGFACVYYTRKSTEVAQNAFLVMAVCMILLAVLMELLYRLADKRVTCVIFGIIFVVSCGNLVIDHSITLYAEREFVQNEDVAEYEAIIKEIQNAEGDVPYRVADVLKYDMPQSNNICSVAVNKDTITDGVENYIEYIGGMGYQEWDTNYAYQNYQFGMPFDAEAANRLGIKYIITDTERNDENWTLFTQHGSYYAYYNNKFSGFGKIYQTSLAVEDYEVLNEMERLLNLQNTVVLDGVETKNDTNPKYSIIKDTINTEGIKTEGITYQTQNHQMQCNIENRSVMILPFCEREQSEKEYLNFFIVTSEPSDIKVELLTDIETKNWESVKGITYSVDGMQEISMNIPSDVVGLAIGFDMENEAVISEPMIYGMSETAANQGTVQWAMKDTDTLNGTIVCEEDSVLYLPVVYDRNWNCVINGKGVELIKANYGFTAVNVEAGTHNITLNYEKQSEIFLWLIVVIGICVLGFLTVFINKNQLLKGMLKGAWLAQDKLMVGAVFLIGFILLLMQHLTLDIFYDDYANAALCYGNVIEGVEGTNYTTSQLWEWVKWCYMNWGGRVLYAALFLIPLLKDGATAYMVVQVFVMLLLIYLLYKMICFYTGQKHSVMAAVILFVLYGLIGRDIHVQGTYWASASILYIWPLVPTFWVLFAFAFLQKRIKNNQPVNLAVCMPFIVIPTFFATFSQEQTGLALLIALFLLIAIGQGKEWKKFRKLNEPVLVTAFVSYILLFAAPGNFVRLETNEFSELSFFEKIGYNLPPILDLFFSNGFLWINLVVCLLICVMAFMLFMKNKKKYFISIPLSLGNALGVIALEKITLPDILQNCFEMEFLIYLAVLCGFYFYETKRSELMALVIAGAASVFCLLMSPAIQHRSYLEYMFIVFVVIAIVAIDIQKALEHVTLGRYLYIALVLVCSLKSVTMFSSLYSGYYENSFSLKYNHNVLSAYDGSQTEINLLKCQNDICRLQMPYDEGFEYIDYWLREYYKIPSFVDLIWEDIPEEWHGEISKDFADYNLSGEFYEDDWLGKKGVMSIADSALEKITIICYLDGDMIAENTLTIEIDGVVTEYVLQAGFQTIDLDVSGIKNSDIAFTTSKTFNPEELGTSTDSRDLSVILKFRVQ